MTRLNSTSHKIVVLTLTHQELSAAWFHPPWRMDETARRFGSPIGFFLMDYFKQTTNSAEAQLISFFEK